MSLCTVSVLDVYLLLGRWLAPPVVRMSDLGTFYCHFVFRLHDSKRETKRSSL